MFELVVFSSYEISEGAPTWGDASNERVAGWGANCDALPPALHLTRSYRHNLNHKVKAPTLQRGSFCCILKQMQTGFRDLDSRTGGFSPGDLVVLGGESGADRSAFALNVALYVAWHGEAAAIFDYATTTERVRQQLTSALTGVPLWAMLGGNVRREDWPKLFSSAHNPIWSRLTIEGSANVTVVQMRDRVRQLSEMQARHGNSHLSLVVAQPLRLMGAATPVAEQLRRRQLATNVIELKRLARDLRVTVLLVGGLDHRFDERRGHPPVLSDLEVPEIAESYADHVLLLNLDARSEGGPGDHGIAEIVVAKTRHGVTGKVRLSWDGDCSSFSSMPDLPASTNI
jgi:replicative DNA helicase